MFVFHAQLTCEGGAGEDAHDLGAEGGEVMQGPGEHLVELALLLLVHSGSVRVHDHPVDRGAVRGVRHPAPGDVLALRHGQGGREDSPPRLLFVSNEV